MNETQKTRNSLVLLMAASLLSACSHTGAVHHAILNLDQDIGISHVGQVSLQGWCKAPQDRPGRNGLARDRF